jgi:hypothetical protein
MNHPEVVVNLPPFLRLTIFLLEFNNGREFTALVITELKLMWPELVIVHGKPRHPQSQGSIERSNRDIHDMLTAWMRDNESNK